jgi:RecA/RadA recombinase
MHPTQNTGTQAQCSIISIIHNPSSSTMMMRRSSCSSSRDRNHNEKQTRRVKASPVPPTDALSLLQQERARIKQCFLEHPDLALPLGVTQLAGPAGSGKTQVSLSMCVSSVLSGRKAVYIMLGGSSNGLVKVSIRLESMLAARLQNTSSASASASAGASTIQHLLSQIWLHSVRNPDDLVECLSKKLPFLLTQHPGISVVILDNIATLFRYQDDPGLANPWHTRSATLFQCSAICKQISTHYQIPLLIINQVTTKLSNNDDSNHHPLSSPHSPHLEPALGLSWSQCCNATWFLTRRSESSTRRVLSCRRSPTTANDTSVEFTIEKEGTLVVI